MRRMRASSTNATFDVDAIRSGYRNPRNCGMKTPSTIQMMPPPISRKEADSEDPLIGKENIGQSPARKKKPGGSRVPLSPLN